MAVGYRPPGLPGMPPPPPGITPPPGRGFPIGPPPPPGFALPGMETPPLGPGFSLPREGPPISHSRHGSETYGSVNPALATLGLPTPIGRPAASGYRAGDHHSESSGGHGLGSSALLEDSDNSYLDGIPNRREAPGPPGGFARSPYMNIANNPWAPAGVGSHPYPPAGGHPGPGWGLPTAFVPMPTPHRGARQIAVRQLLCRACQDLREAGESDAAGFIDLGLMKKRFTMLVKENVSDEEIFDLCETEGNQINGGGSFDLHRDANGPGKHAIRWHLIDAGYGAARRAVGLPLAADDERDRARPDGARTPPTRPA